jgi:hypothetical protein
MNARSSKAYNRARHNPHNTCTGTQLARVSLNCVEIAGPSQTPRLPSDEASNPLSEQLCAAAVPLQPIATPQAAETHGQGAVNTDCGRSNINLSKNTADNSARFCKRGRQFGCRSQQWRSKVHTGLRCERAEKERKSKNGFSCEKFGDFACFSALTLASHSKVCASFALWGDSLWTAVRAYCNPNLLRDSVSLLEPSSLTHCAPSTQTGAGHAEAT